MKRPDPRTINCAHCARECVVAAPSARYCSMICAASDRPWRDVTCVVCGKVFRAQALHAVACGDECRRVRSRQAAESQRRPEAVIKRAETTHAFHGAVLSRGTGDARERRMDCVRVLSCLGEMPRAFSVNAHLSCAACPVHESTTADTREESGLGGHRRR